MTSNLAKRTHESKPGIYSGQIRIAITDGRELNIDFNSKMTPDEISDKISEYGHKGWPYYYREKFKYDHFKKESRKRRNKELSYWLYIDLSCNLNLVLFPGETLSEKSLFSVFIEETLNDAILLSSLNKQLVEIEDA
uniref:Uncharacterized protein n=1 Tax=Romanomermis culicivorax TaxID=13658 RepID=A0A915HRP6_ROMCU